MTASTAESTPRVRGEHGEERSRRRELHSLSGIVPVGFFLVEHTVLAATALRGQGAFERAVVFVEGLPAWRVIEALLILVPLAFHAFYGVFLIADRKESAKGDDKHWPYRADWAWLSRASAMIALAFIGYHFYELRFARWFGGVAPRSLYTLLVNDLSSTGPGEMFSLPWISLLYLLGIAATTLHFAVGMWGFLVRRRYVTAPKSIRRAAFGSGAFGAILFAVSATAVISLATGSPQLPVGADSPTIQCPPP